MAGESGYSFRLSDSLNNPEEHFLALTSVKVKTLADPEIKLDTPFLAVNKSVVTMVRAIKEGDFHVEASFSSICRKICDDRAK